MPRRKVEYISRLHEDMTRDIVEHFDAATITGMQVMAYFGIKARATMIKWLKDVPQVHVGGRLKYPAFEIAKKACTTDWKELEKDDK